MSETEFGPEQEIYESLPDSLNEVEAPSDHLEAINPKDFLAFDQEKQKRLEEIMNRINLRREQKRETQADIPQSNHEIVEIGGKKFKIYYVPKEALAPGFGMAYRDGTADVREDLHPRIKKFVKAHEIYHLADQSHFLGHLGGEFRANFFCGLKDPIGLAATAAAAIRRGGLQMFWRKIRKDGFLNQFR